jgi:hypothetical protein
VSRGGDQESLRHSAFLSLKGRAFSGALLAFFALRMIVWGALLPPWGGFDEVAHQGLIETCADQSGWPRFLSVVVPPRLVKASATTRTMANYETQQSPLYYIAAGRLMRLLPRWSPAGELYFLRFLSILLTLGVAILTLRASKSFDLPSRVDWLPLAWISFIPGFAIALVRVSNDALAAFLIAAALAALVRDGETRPGKDLAGAVAAGLAPWAKLYGAVVVPVSAAHWFLHRRGGERTRLLSLVLVPPALLAMFSWRLNGTIVPLQENLSAAAPVRLSEVPWARDLWTVAKTHIWVSGSDATVFPTWVYLFPVFSLVVICVGALVEGAGGGEPPAPRRAATLAVTIGFFGAAQAYHALRNFAANRKPGGSGGWYLWGTALAEALLLSLLFGMRPRLRRWLPFLFGVFLALTILGDIAVAADSGKLLIVTEMNRHILGLRSSPIRLAVETFVSSRPAPVAILAMVLAPVSWMAGLAAILAVARGVKGSQRLRVV